MIKSLSIQNFQSHEKTELEFHSGVNTIIGSSDCGKTAIIRALRWLVWNRPSGDAIRSRWGGSTDVRVETEEGDVTRTKDKVDLYTLDRRGSELLKFKAFGTSVPEEVSRFLNISEINLQSQLDAPFLVSSTAGEVAAHFNKIVRLDIIDRGLQNIQSWIRELTSTIGAEAAKDKPATGLIKQIEDKKSALEKFEHLAQFEIEVEVLEEMEQRLPNMQAALSRLQTVVESLEGKEEELTNLSSILSIESIVNQMLSYYSEIKELERNIDLITLLIDKIESKQELQVEYTSRIEISPLVDSLIADKTKLADLQRDYTAVNKLVNTIYRLETDLVISKGKTKGLEDKFHKEMPDICPLCDTLLTKKK
jgi:DNA repair ATPase RecN